MSGEGNLGGGIPAGASLSSATGSVPLKVGFITTPGVGHPASRRGEVGPEQG